jgi:hypothetical protein
MAANCNAGLWGQLHAYQICKKCLIMSMNFAHTGHVMVSARSCVKVLDEPGAECSAPVELRLACS